MENVAVNNILAGLLWAQGAPDSSVTIARPGGRGWAFAEVQLGWLSRNATAQAWISGYRYQPSPDQIINVVSPDPAGAPIATWIDNCLSATFSLRVSDGWAAATGKLSPWE
jgi:hypothetical protein